MIRTAECWQWLKTHLDPVSEVPEPEPEDSAVSVLEALVRRHHAVQEPGGESQRGHGRQQPRVSQLACTVNIVWGEITFILLLSQSSSMKTSFQNIPSNRQITISKQKVYAISHILSTAIQILHWGCSTNSLSPASLLFWDFVLILYKFPWEHLCILSLPEVETKH